MNEKIKNATILEKTVRPEKAKMLKQVQHDMVRVQRDMCGVQDDSLIKNNGVGKTVRPDKAQILKQVQDDMRRVQHDMGWFRRGFGALAPDKNFSPFTFHFSQRCAFTLAEVLITLGIIGVVAAVTIPSLIQIHKKNVVETRLKKFYSVMSNAILISVANNGEPSTWDYPAYKMVDGKYTTDMNVDRLKWLNKYLVPYLKITKIDSQSVSTSNGRTNRPILYFADGSVAVCVHEVGLADWNFYPEAKNMPSVLDNGMGVTGKDFFRFNFFKTNPYFIPYGGTDNRDAIDAWAKDGFKSKCLDNASYCTFAIMYNGWKIPDWYPYKF